jgi:hypothetical protein
MRRDRQPSAMLRQMILAYIPTPNFDSPRERHAVLRSSAMPGRLR